VEIDTLVIARTSLPPAMHELMVGPLDLAVIDEEHRFTERLSTTSCAENSGSLPRVHSLDNARHENKYRTRMELRINSLKSPSLRDTQAR
jgi:hypothetical protein